MTRRHLFALASSTFVVALCSLCVRPCSPYLIAPQTPINRHPSPPKYSPATGLPNRIYKWRGQNVRYQVSGPPDADHSVVLVHGLFVNSDHWRKALKGLADAGYRTYAVDLLGYGYSSKPPSNGEEAMRLNGENGRFVEERDIFDVESNMLDDAAAAAAAAVGRLRKNAGSRVPPVVKNVVLGSNDGGRERVRDVDLRHPLKSCYNFYTWSEQIVDFTRDIVLQNEGPSSDRKATLVCNSMGTIVSMQALLDSPDYFDGVFMVNPTFREMHSSEVKMPALTVPLIRTACRFLREKGHALYKAVAKPDTVRQILEEPYAATDAVDDDLVHALLEPLTLPNAADVVFDTLSYTGGPLLEQQLQDPNFDRDAMPPVWLCYGDADPWTPLRRVERLAERGALDRVVPLPGVGHCPHDEAPELVNSLLLEFLGKVKRQSWSGDENVFAGRGSEARVEEPFVVTR